MADRTEAAVASEPATNRLFARPAAYPQHKRISYFQHGIWVAPPAEPWDELPLSGTGEFFYLSNDSGTDLRDVSIRLAPIGEVWKYWVSEPLGLARSDVRIEPGDREVLIELDLFPADASFQLVVVSEGHIPEWDRLESNNESAFLIPLNSRRVGMDAGHSER